MWLFCKSGFFSAVQHFENSELIHVRARFQGDLERLCTAHGITPAIMHTPNNDYAYRMDFPRKTWSEIVGKEAENIDYSNFKDAVHDGTVRDYAYMNIWSAMRRAQD
ncbi:MAG: hypothetical protein Q4C70_12030 [Planctomycetia bacterium]|nr:hypothetical protein [Planctomycetia bacterium]